MEAGQANPEPAARRHIIERPRLTRLLDQAQARVIMLVAAAGYGKTTLARQWLNDKPHAWYSLTPASSDVAAPFFCAGRAFRKAAPLKIPPLFERAWVPF